MLWKVGLALVGLSIWTMVPPFSLTAMDCPTAPGGGGSRAMPSAPFRALFVMRVVTRPGLLVFVPFMMTTPPAAAYNVPSGPNASPSEPPGDEYTEIVGLALVGF